MNNLYNLFTCSQEYSNDFPDKFGRARFYNTHNKTIFSPVVSEEICSKGLKPYYPDGKEFAVCISHDIDHLYLHQSSPRKMVNFSKELARGRFNRSMGHLKSIVRDRIYKDYDLQKLIEINNRYNIHSTYYFLSLESDEEDYNYSPDQIQDQFKYVLENNNEIGLHGGHIAYSNLEKLNQEKQLLEKYTGASMVGYRNHYLRFEIPATWRNLEKSGFLYDTTLGYVDCAGFRNGMCYPFYPFDIEKNKFLNIIELPLIIMDVTLFYYMRLDASIAFKICKQLIESVKACKGVLTLLWHNNFLTGEMGAFYLQLLDYLKSEDPWFTTSNELVTWWKKEKLLEQSQEILGALIKNNKE